MANFHDALNEFGTAFELPPEIRDGLTAAYDMDFQGYDSKVHELENQIATKDTEFSTTKQQYEERISAVKAANFDLLRSGLNGSSAGSSADDDNDNPDGDNGNITVDDLFRSKK